MADARTNEYADRLARLIRVQTVSAEQQDDKSVFYQFQDLLRELFPHIFSVCSFEDFNGSFFDFSVKNTVAELQPCFNIPFCRKGRRC